MIEANLMGEKRDEKEVVFQVGLLQRHTILMLEPTFLGILRDTTHSCLAKQVLKLYFNRAKHGPTTFRLGPGSTPKNMLTAKVTPSGKGVKPNLICVYPAKFAL